MSQVVVWSSIARNQESPNETTKYAATATPSQTVGDIVRTFPQPRAKAPGAPGEGGGRSVIHSTPGGPAPVPRLTPHALPDGAAPSGHGGGTGSMGSVPGSGEAPKRGSPGS